MRAFAFMSRWVGPMSTAEYAVLMLTLGYAAGVVSGLVLAVAVVR